MSAADLLSDAVDLRLMRQVVIKDAKAWQRLYDELRDAITRTANEQGREAIIEGLDRLRELGPGDFVAADRAPILAAIRKHMGGPALEAAMRGPVLRLSDAIFRVGADEIGRATGVDIGFMRPDLDALDVIAEGNLYWVGNSWNSHVQDKMTRALDDYFRAGMTREQLAQRLAEDFAGASPMGTGYWEMLADHTATKTREMGRVTGYERAAVEYVQVRAHLDEHTTQQCRSMHGRVIPVSKLSQQRDDYLAAIKTRDLVSAKEVWVMHRDASALAGIKTGDLPPGTASPPYHFLCRTITVAYFSARHQVPVGSTAVVEQTEVDRWQSKTFNREPLSRKETEALIERSKTARWSSPDSMAEHLEKHGRRHWGSAAGYGQAAIDIIRRGDRDVHVSVRRGRMKALFTERRRKGAVSLVVVDVASNQIETLHIRSAKRLSSITDDVPAIKQPARGITKWFH